MTGISSREECEIKVYEEVESVLKVLKEEGYELVVSSNAATEFVDFQIHTAQSNFLVME
jgi:phosphoglycolate phosphatase-like HAD superfamily hydrolase